MVLGNILCILLWILHISSVIGLSRPNIPRQDIGREHWNTIARDYITRRLGLKENTKVAKNVILFVGDGMGPTTVAAARILRGQLNGQPGEETVLKFEEFPNVALSKVYNVDRQSPDSAGTATAMLTGVKTDWFFLGVDARATIEECNTTFGRELSTMLEWSKEEGKSVGVVSTARITHATPAASYAKSVYRYWEGDVDMVNVTGGCTDIAYQLINNTDIEVIMGGGRRYFMLDNQTDPETGNIHKTQRKDGQDLIQIWKDKKEAMGKSYKYVWNKGQFNNVDPSNTDYLLGLFQDSHMQYALDRDDSDQGEPTLADMTKKAIQILEKNGDGYFLFVESARIDHGHHDSLAKKALHEVLVLEDAVKAAVDLTNDSDTLIIVTADHSLTFGITGYQYRGSDIFGFVEPIDPTELPMDNFPYTVLIYGNGPGYEFNNRTNLTNVDIKDKDYIYPSAVPLPWTTHGAEDVHIYATGPMAHLLHGVHEQNYIGHVMSYAACVGPYKDQCDRLNREQINKDNSNNKCTSNATRIKIGQTYLILICYIVILYIRFL